MNFKYLPIPATWADTRTDTETRIQGTHAAQVALHTDTQADCHAYRLRCTQILIQADTHAGRHTYTQIYTQILTQAHRYTHRYLHRSTHIQTFKSPFRHMDKQTDTHNRSVWLSLVPEGPGKLQHSNKAVLSCNDQSSGHVHSPSDGNLTLGLWSLH